MLNIGDSVGGIYQKSKNGVTWFELVEDVIVKIVITEQDTYYHTKSRFHPLHADEVDTNTRLFESEFPQGIYTTQHIFALTDNLRHYATQWINYANENLDKASTTNERN